MTTVKQKKIVLPVVDVSNKEVEKMELDPNVFDGRLSRGSIYRTVHNYLANKRAGTASTKTRGEVSGSGKKPWRQKGTGRARVGSIRTPLWRHGGVIFGPQPRNFSYRLPKKIKRLALKSTLNDRVLNKDLIVVNTLISESYKTKKFAEVLRRLKLKDKILLVLSSNNDEMIACVRNMPNIKVVDSQSLNAYDILRFKKILFTKDALQHVIRRLK